MNIIKSIYSGIKASVFLLGVFSLSSCLENGDETIILETGTVLGIPSDEKADPNPVISNPNAYIPNIQYLTEKVDGQYVMRIDMTGIQDPNTKEWLKLFGTNSNEESSQNIWVSVDNKPKGFIVKNTIDNEDNNGKVMNDIVFLVDNSGSMSEEANAIARDIISWAQKLSSTLDVKFGCVGYNGRITGAINLTSYNAMSEYLNRSTGTSRTVGFSGADAEKLEYVASSYANSNECGTVALRFADEQFTFRNGANRIYINFTDEPNQPNGQEGFSVLFVNDQNNWNTSQGTIHTVFSGNKNFTESFYYRECPWRMSDYTGGTTLYASSSFTGVTLDDLPVTDALQNSYVIYFTNIKEFMDGQVHQVKISVLSEDGTVRGEKIFYVIFGEEKDTDDNDNEGNISKSKLIGEWRIETYLFEVYKNGKLIESEVEEEGLESFNSNGVYIYNDGSNDTGKWTLSSNKLTIKFSEDDTEIWTITKLTSSEMIRELQESEDGYIYKYKITSKKL